MTSGYSPHEHYLTWLRGPWRALDFDDHKVDHRDYRSTFRAQHDAVVDLIERVSSLAGARPYAWCEGCDAVVVLRGDGYVWRAHPSAEWVAVGHDRIVSAVGEHGHLSSDPERFEWYLELAMSPFKLFRRGTLAEMLSRDPSLGAGEPFPPLRALNDLLSVGQFGGGMSTGVQFSPLRVSAKEHEAIAEDVRAATPWMSTMNAPAHLATMDDFRQWWSDRLASYPQHRHDSFSAEIRAASKRIRRLPEGERAEAQAAFNMLLRDRDDFLSGVC